MRFISIVLGIVFGGWLASGCIGVEASDAHTIAGVSLVNPPQPIPNQRIHEVKRIHANWVSVIPYGFSRAQQPDVSFDHPGQWWGERTEGTSKLIQYAQDAGIKVMLKPHVWVMGEGWTGDFEVSTEEEWKRWETDYSNYLLHFARLADSMNVDMLCIGTEYRIPAKKRSSYWITLIDEVREVYSGTITYASNWDNYQQITWWDKVDLIGIDAYFPLVQEAHPSKKEIKEGWQPILSDLSAFSARWNKPIVFTEFGFLSANGATWNHWEVDLSDANVNLELQAEAYDATFEVLSDQDWFAGGFVWKWHLTQTRRRQKTQWSPQGKPAEKVIARWYQERTKN